MCTFGFLSWRHFRNSSCADCSSITVERAGKWEVELQQGETLSVIGPVHADSHLRRGTKLHASINEHGLTMDQYDYDLDPFSSESLWRLSKFSIEALQPLESLPWNASLSG